MAVLHPDADVFLAAGRMYSDAGFLHRDRPCFCCAVRSDDQYKGMVCLSDGVSVFCDNLGIWEIGGQHFNRAGQADTVASHSRFDHRSMFDDFLYPLRAG